MEEGIKEDRSSMCSQRGAKVVKKRVRGAEEEKKKKGVKNTRGKNVGKKRGAGKTARKVLGGRDNNDQKSQKK